MKSFGRGVKRNKRGLQCVIVDGYNVVAQMQRSALEALEDVDAARDQLLDLLKEYRAFSGDDVIVVYDAHHAKKPGSETMEAGVRIIFTSHQETADERIERLVYELRDTYRQITVATSDFAEQQVTFGGGALRISAREFLQQLRDLKLSIRRTVENKNDSARTPLVDTIRHDIANILEKWRRG